MKPPQPEALRQHIHGPVEPLEYDDGIAFEVWALLLIFIAAFAIGLGAAWSLIF